MKTPEGFDEGSSSEMSSTKSGSQASVSKASKAEAAVKGKTVSGFGELHPAVGFAFFALVLAITMTASHPVILLCSLFGGLAYALFSFPNALRELRFIPILAVLTAVINPLFSHEGMTILAYFPSGNPLTLESIVAGLCSAIMLSAVVCWFYSLTRVLTSDKFIWLFGRAAPALSLVLSMTLRFVPHFASQLREAYDAELLISCPKNRFERLKSAISALSGSVTRALEASIETADSMRSRGYGLKNRTAYTTYRLDDRDKGMLTIILLSGGFALSGQLCKGLYWRSYPTLRSVEPSRFTIGFFAAFAVLALTPFIFDALEDRKWKSLR